MLSHYVVKTKPQREAVLLDFVNECFLAPAVARIQQVFDKHHQRGQPGVTSNRPPSDPGPDPTTSSVPVKSAVSPVKTATGRNVGDFKHTTIMSPSPGPIRSPRAQPEFGLRTSTSHSAPLLHGHPPQPQVTMVPQAGQLTSQSQGHGMFDPFLSSGLYSEHGDVSGPRPFNSNMNQPRSLWGGSHVSPSDMDRGCSDSFWPSVQTELAPTHTEVPVSVSRLPELGKSEEVFQGRLHGHHNETPTLTSPTNSTTGSSRKRKKASLTQTPLLTHECSHCLKYTSSNLEQPLPTSSSKYTSAVSTCMATQGLHNWIRLDVRTEGLPLNTLSGSGSDQARGSLQGLLSEHVPFLRSEIQREFRTAYILNDQIVKRLVSKLINEFYSEQALTRPQLTHLNNGVLAYTRSKWKIYLNLLPTKAYARLCEEYVNGLIRKAGAEGEDELPTASGETSGGDLFVNHGYYNVALIKTIVSKKRVLNDLLKHPCFKSSLQLSDDLLRRLRKEVEQRVLVEVAVEQTEPNERASVSIAHHSGFLNWRKDSLYSALSATDPLYVLDLLEVDKSSPLTRSYTPYVSKRQQSARKKLKKQEFIDELLSQSMSSVSTPSTAPTAHGSSAGSGSTTSNHDHHVPTASADLSDHPQVTTIDSPDLREAESGHTIAAEVVQSVGLSEGEDLV